MEPQPTQEQFKEIERQIAELRSRVDAVEAACRAFAVVYAIPRVPTPGDEGMQQENGMG